MAVQGIFRGDSGKTQRFSFPIAPGQQVSREAKSRAVWAPVLLDAIGEIETVSIRQSHLANPPSVFPILQPSGIRGSETTYTVMAVCSLSKAFSAIHKLAHLLTPE